MEPNKLDPRDFFAYKLGPAGLSSLAQFKIAASNAKSHLDAINKIKERSSGELDHLTVGLYCDAINVECAGIIEAYDAFNVAPDRTSLFLKLSEIAYRVDRAVANCESLSTRLEEQGKHIDLSNREGKEVSRRCKEVIQVIKGAAKLRKNLNPITTSAALFS